MPPGAANADASPQVSNPSGAYIKHIVVIVQENRTFENFFAGYPGADAPMYGFAKVNGVRRRIPLHQITFRGPDLRHDWHGAITDWDHGKMDGFNTFGNPKKGPYSAYAYVQRSLVGPYWTMAKRYVLADHMFPTEFGGSFTGHLTLIAGTDNLKPNVAEVDFPSIAPDDCDSPPGTKSSLINERRRKLSFKGPFPCFTQFRTIADTLDAAGITWKYYATHVSDGGMWEPFEAIENVRYGPDWPSHIIAPETQMLTDASGADLAQVTWVSPSRKNSDHPTAHSDTGPSWVADIVNAIGESPNWNSTAIVVVWDDWGGWYDNAKPPQLDFRGLGIRVPCLIISPYARKGYVSHTLYEWGSILKFTEQVFNLEPLGPTSEGYTDTRANSLVDSFDFTQKPRKFKPIPAPYSASYLLAQPPSNEPVDTQ